MQTTLAVQQQLRPSVPCAFRTSNARRTPRAAAVSPRAAAKPVAKGRPAARNVVEVEDPELNVPAELGAAVMRCATYTVCSNSDAVLGRRVPSYGCGPGTVVIFMSYPETISHSVTMGVFMIHNGLDKLADPEVRYPCSATLTGDGMPSNKLQNHGRLTLAYDHPSASHLFPVCILCFC